jgi:hypothetical protein
VRFLRHTNVATQTWAKDCTITRVRTAFSCIK